MNKNCLEGIACPVCQHEDEFTVWATAAFSLTDEGTDLLNHASVEWDEESWLQCSQCGHRARMKKFRIPKKGKKK